MRKHNGLSHRRRPNLDALEDRCLLSGYHELPGRPDPPAVVARMGSRDAAHPEVNHLHPLIHPEDAFHDPNEPVAPRAWEGEPRPECDAARFGNTPVAIQGSRGGGGRSRNDSENLTVPLALTAPAPVTLLFPVSRAVPNERSVITARPSDGAASRSEERRELTAKTSPEILAESNPSVKRATADPTDPPPGDCVEVSPLRGAGLIADLLPFDRASLEAAVDRFFDRFEDFDMGRLGWEDPATMIPPSVALVLATTALEVARRRLRRTSSGRESVRGRLPEERLSLLGFPELPGPWSTRTP